jgi:hypothetical protein
MENCHYTQNLAVSAIKLSDKIGSFPAQLRNEMACLGCCNAFGLRKAHSFVKMVMEAQIGNRVLEAYRARSGHFMGIGDKSRH